MHFLIPFLRTEMVSGSSSRGKREEEAGRQKMAEEEQ